MKIVKTDTMSSWQFPGARWWRFDFHTHTPGSGYFKDGNEVTPQVWLRKFMEKEIDCVAITDHNSGAWVDKLKDELDTLSNQKPEWYRPLRLFPGVEISVTGEVHLLAVFDPCKTESDIDSLLGAIGYERDTGLTIQSVPEVVDKITNAGGVAIPAHAGNEKGLFNKLTGETLKQALKRPGIYAMELCDNSVDKPPFKPPPLYAELKLQWTEVQGSDVHDFHDKKFGTFTWIKMDEPSIEGLKLALIDGSASVSRDEDWNPNQPAEYIIEEIAVRHAKYMGRSDTLTCRFSPFLNTIIGGRGSGKSTLLEFMRFVMRREKEIPENLTEENQKYFSVEDGLLLEKSELHVYYRKGETRYRLTRSTANTLPSLQMETEKGWQDEEGNIKDLFPVYIYSQKQIFALAQNPVALLNIIDKNPSVKLEEFEKNHACLLTQYKKLEQQNREIKEKIAKKSATRGLLNDVSRQVEQIEKSGHKEVLQNYRQRQNQLTSIGNLEEKWKRMITQIGEMCEGIAPTPLDEQVFSDHQEILQSINATNKKWLDVSQLLEQLNQEARNIMNGWEKEKSEAKWMKSLGVDIEKYKQLRTQIEQQNIDPEKYPKLLQLQAQYHKELEQIEDYIPELEKLEQNKQDVLRKIEAERENLTQKRKNFLSQVLSGNQSIDIEVEFLGQRWNGCEAGLRRILQCDDTRFEKDFSALKTIHQEEEDRITAVRNIKDKLVKIRNDEKDAEDSRFANHLKNLPQESISEMMCWFPQDELIITFGDNNRSIKEGSPGEKAATLLAFILSYGDAPLLLDQPEDDLDNELIYDLIIKQLREAKTKRQIIIVTHNANIVVNGDAEMVFPLKVANGESHLEKPASIQNNHIRESICNILEGGEKAFQKRYQRIYLENL